MSGTDPSLSVDFLVRRDALGEFEFAAGKPLAAGDGQVVLRVERFAFTANNVTYAVFGDQMGYWRFFPAPDEAWGRIPVWGFATVSESRNAEIAVGERVFGFLPLGTHALITPSRIAPGGFTDAAAHRAELPPIYNQYLRTAEDPGYRADREGLQALFRPLFTTGFLIDDFLADNDFFGARAVIVTSASSKTAFGLAEQLSRRVGCEVIGLTSPGNVAFVTGLQCYDRVLDYDRIDEISASLPVAYVDIAGNAKVRAALHHHFGDALRYSCAVGGSHWDQMAPTGDLPGAPPTFFFAPTQIAKRQQDWGPRGVQERVAQAWARFAPKAGALIDIVEAHGQDAVSRVYTATLEGRVPPNEGHVLSLWPDVE